MKKRENCTDDLKEKETSNDPHHPNSLRHCDKASRTEKQVTGKENSRPASNLMKDPHDPDHLRNRDTYRANAVAKEKTEAVEDEIEVEEAEEADEAEEAEEADEVEKASSSNRPSHAPKFPPS